MVAGASTVVDGEIGAVKSELAAAQAETPPQRA
jgi:hypothetical protein